MENDNTLPNDSPSPSSPTGYENHAFSTDEEAKSGKPSLSKREPATLPCTFENEDIIEKQEASLPGPGPSEEVTTSELIYSVEDVPPWYTSVVLGMQHFLTMVGGTISIPYILTPLMCIDDNDPARGKIVCTILFVSGMITLLQSTIGVRLPIIQGGTFSFLVPTIAILTTSFEPCSDVIHQNMTSSEIEETWQVRMREVQGAIAVASIVQVIIGFSGLIGIILQWITPLTIVPTVTLVGLSLFNTAAEKASLHWGIAFMTIALLILFSQYIKEVPVPVPVFKKSSGWTVSKIYIFKLFPIGMTSPLFQSGGMVSDCHTAQNYIQPADQGSPAALSSSTLMLQIPASFPSLNPIAASLTPSREGGHSLMGGSESVICNPAAGSSLRGYTMYNCLKYSAQ